MQRENATKLIPKHGRMMNPESLRTFNDAIDTTRTRFQEQFSSFHHIDTGPGSTLAQVGAAAQVSRFMLAQLEADLRLVV